ncbi:tRNA threonylcarbamoyl adenosine modification protein (Sua5/YciO/YrdC/YwlC family) [Arcanobacterium wilhelmae]|uniref:tRNA threonylcarbamoyl adenosine modification protein (Sua5/YciO/YrdC/YwlC family) n=1 Tax=Arcanobacterium wilhelmae TaxID=1803177 RepID=A0ABT9N935_9ACTO|nr:L-threonylcarbamoyladenylate synthase [Arcanobacterium wilhelmae]MDP9800210.1 tRNA threonylcarbamoyl adenosine modification protein (Sua5/YciO/YrdC/YwlC family) [Arcanobacterium wilhelmae]WFN89650.1 L-threonylcarbamoyladenylate synthase [Arcanobacterium wilhelmae]
MSRLVEIHPTDPQQRLVDKVVDRLRDGGVVAMPTDSGYALVTTMGNKDGLERIRRIRGVGEEHHFTLLCHDFAQLGNLVIVDNRFFRLVKSLTPGPYTFIFKGTKEVPKVSLNAKKSTIGARIPDHKVTQTILAAMGEALISSTLILPGEDELLTEGWRVQDELGDAVDLVIDGEIDEPLPTSVIDLSSGEAMIAREGAGDLSMFVEA